MGNDLSSFIDVFLEDFSGKIDEDIFIKLQILKLLDSNKPTNEIVAEIKKQFPKYQIKNSSLAKKIRRIKKYTQIYYIPELISIKRLTEIIMKKYPIPGIIGLPFEFWEEVNMYNFIRFYFKFPNETKIADLNINTLYKYIYKKKTGNLSIKENGDYYYISIIRKPYSNIPMHHQGNKRYNHLYFGAIFLIDNNDFEKVKGKAISVSEGENFIHACDPFISELLKDIACVGEGKPIVFICKNEVYENCIFRKQENFHEFFRFNWCQFKDLKDLYNILKKNTFQINPSRIDNLKKAFDGIKAMEDKCDNISTDPIIDFFEFDEEKNYYIDEIQAIIETSSSNQPSKVH